MIASAPLTVEEYLALYERRVFGDRRTELVGGEIEFKMGHGRRHARTCTRALQALSWLEGEEEILYTEVTVALSPVVARDQDLLLGRRSSFDRGPMDPKDISLIIEVTDSTAHTDLEIKRREYASAFIPIYWSIDPVGRRLHVFRDP